MGLNMNAGISYLLMNENMDGSGYKKYEGHSILMIGKQGVNVTYRQFCKIKLRELPSQEPQSLQK